MTHRTWCLVGPLVLFLAVTCCGQTISPLQDTRRPVGAPIANPTPTPGVVPEKRYPAIEGESMPFDRIDQPTSLDTELEAIRAKLPEFNSVVVRGPGVPNDYPTLPVMTLKNVTLGQFLQFVQASYPSVSIMRIDGTAGALYSIRIRAEGDALQRADARQDRVRLYRLNELINSLADETAKNKDDKDTPRADRVKEATNQVLSLLQAALDQTDGDGPSTLKIHEPTLTLMFKGSQPKQTVLEEALEALQPRRSAFGRSTVPAQPMGANNPFELYQAQAALDQIRMAQDQARKAQEDAAAARAEMNRKPKPDKVDKSKD